MSPAEFLIVLAIIFGIFAVAAFVAEWMERHDA